MVSRVVHLGMDDIDSPQGGCTTHFASLLVEKLHPLVDEWLDYPHLIRFNPNIPYRTRGNGGICLSFNIDSTEIDELLPLTSDMIHDYADLEYPNTNPGVAFVLGEIPSSLRSFSQKALWRVVPRSLALRLIERNHLQHLMFGGGRGIIGAIAAIGHGLRGDHTYEYLSYRRLDEVTKDRNVDRSSVVLMDKEMGDRTFSNLDSMNGNILIEPKGPDPVLYGIRGEEPQDVIKAASYVLSAQEVDRWMVFKTNQGTGEHLSHEVTIDRLRPYMSATLTAKVAKEPHIQSGGHVIFIVSDDYGEVQCAAYEPTGDFRWDVMKLRTGDRLIMHIGVRPPSQMHVMTLNVEGMTVTHLVDHLEYSNPLCNGCGKRMKSAGRDKGFKCIHCGHIEREAEKEKRVIPRNLLPGHYLPPLSAQRHLTRPYSRIGRANRSSARLIELWYYH